MKLTYLSSEINYSWMKLTYLLNAFLFGWEICKMGSLWPKFCRKGSFENLFTKLGRFVRGEDDF